MTSNIFWVGFWVALFTGGLGMMGRLSMLATTLIAGVGVALMASAIVHG